MGATLLRLPSVGTDRYVVLVDRMPTTWHAMERYVYVYLNIHQGGQALESDAATWLVFLHLALVGTQRCQKQRVDK